jgi:predicted DNA-binding protein (MmcQ/YjbR family)
MHNLVQRVKDHCAQKPQVTQGYPWKNKRSLAFKVAGKLFAAIDEDKNPLRLNLRCEPGRMNALKRSCSAVVDHPIHPATWITIQLEESLSGDLLKTLIDDSFSLAIQTLSRKERAQLGS